MRCQCAVPCAHQLSPDHWAPDTAEPAHVVILTRLPQADQVHTRARTPTQALLPQQVQQQPKRWPCQARAAPRHAIPGLGNNPRLSATSLSRIEPARAHVKMFARMQPNKPKFQISPERTIGHGHPTFIIAEMSCNHHGSLDKVRRCLSSQSRNHGFLTQPPVPPGAGAGACGCGVRRGRDQAADVPGAGHDAG